MTVSIAIVDYGLANIRSVVNALSCFSAEIRVIDNGSDLKGADAIVLPGVGSFGAGMRELRARGHASALYDLVVGEKRPFLGICLGMQFVYQGSDEADEDGLGWLPGTVRRLPSRDAGNTPVKVPHIGWNEVRISNNSRLMKDIDSGSDFYFNHSYYVPLPDAEERAIVHRCQYGVGFAASVEKDNLYICQFHPEKSQLAGMKMLESFIALAADEIAGSV